MKKQQVKPSTGQSSKDEAKKPSKYHIKNKKHQQHHSARSNKGFMSAGIMSGTGFRRKIQTVDDDETMDSEEMEAIQQEENLKRKKYGKRQLLDNSFRFQNDEDENYEESPGAAEQKIKAKQQHFLNKMEKDTMMMISNSITLTQSFGSSRGLLEWEDEKDLELAAQDRIIQKLFYLDQNDLTRQIKDSSISVEERLNLIDITGNVVAPTEHNLEKNEVLSPEFKPMCQYLRREHVEMPLSSDEDEEDIMSDEENIVEETTSPSALVDEQSSETPVSVEEELLSEKPLSTPVQKSSDLDDIIELEQSKYQTISAFEPKQEPNSVVSHHNEDILDDLLSLSQQTSSPARVETSGTKVTQQVPEPTTTSQPQQTSAKKNETEDLDAWLDDLL